MAGPVDRPLILVTNDDGVDAAGIDALREAVEPVGEVWVVAPSDQQSAVSNAISLRDPLRVKELGERRMAVSGTPTDCVYVALNHVLDRRPAMCVAGINHGANLGDDVLYSGTVAAAIEATMCDIPSMAFSLAGYGNHQFDGAIDHIRRMARDLLRRDLPRSTLLNVNFPSDVDSNTSTQLTKLGRRNYGRVVVEKEDPRNRSYYWLGGSELGFDDIPGSDCNAVADGVISITPVNLDLTDYRLKREMGEWSSSEDSIRGRAAPSKAPEDQEAS